MGVKMCSKAMASKKTNKRVARKNSKTLNVIKLNVNLGHPVGLIFGSILLSIMARINTYVIYMTKLFIWNMEKIAISHICSMHGNVDTYKCCFEDCTYEAKTKLSLKAHSIKHTGIKKYQCHLCDMKFTRSQTRNP